MALSSRCSLQCNWVLRRILSPEGMFAGHRPKLDFARQGYKLEQFIG
jgi:hypothetical protein